jgi:hypothetical protein
MVQVDGEALQAQESQGGDNLVLVPMRRSDLRCIKAVKFNEAELAKIAKFQEWLAATINPETGQPFIPRNEFSALVQFCLNLAFRHMAAVAEQMAQAEAES